MLEITQGNICYQSLVSILGLASHRVTYVVSLLVVFHSPLSTTQQMQSLFITLSGLGGYTWCIISIVKAWLLKIPAGHNHWFTDCIVLETLKINEWHHMRAHTHTHTHAPTHTHACTHPHTHTVTVRMKTQLINCFWKLNTLQFCLHNVTTV